MKKSLLFLSLLSSLTMVSCGGSDVDTSKIALDYGYKYKNPISSVEDLRIGYETLTDRIGKKESFVLLIFGDSTCGCWVDFNPLAISFMNRYHVKFSVLNLASLEGESETYGIYRGYSQMPGICFFRRGQLIRQTIYGLVKGTDINIFKKQETLDEFLLNNIYLPRMFYLDKDALDEKIENQEEFNLYIARSGCGDCSAINSSVLYEYSEKNKEKAIPNKPLYIFDIQQYRGTDEYQTIKDTYGLSNTTFNPIFGYDYGEDKGMIPTFQVWKQGYIYDMITVLNDHLGENHTLDSYFNIDRVGASPMLSRLGNEYVLQGKALEDKDIGKYPVPGTEIIYEYVYRDSQLVWHKPIVELYLSTYVK